MKYDESEILRVAKIDAANIVKTADVYKVVKFYPSTQTVDVEACVKPYQKDINGEIKKDMYNNYTRLSQTHDSIVILNIPVLQFRCGQFSVTAPLESGDTGLVVFLKNDIENWRVEGGTTGAYHVYPYDINSCVFCPFVPNQANKDMTFNANSLEIKSKSVIITVNEDTIEVTATTTDITSDIKVKGDVDIEGDVNIKGDVNTTGKLEVSETITADKEITGLDCKTTTGVSLQNHPHDVSGVQAGQATVTSAPPTPTGP